MHKIKYLALIFVVILLVQTVSADAIATIGTQGLSMARPLAAQALNTVMGLSNPVQFFTGQMIGQIQGEAFQALAKASPEAAKAVQAFQQVQGYVNEGAQVVNELKINDQGKVTDGTIKFGEKQAFINNLIGEDIKDKQISVTNAELTKKDGASTIEIKDKGNLVITQVDDKGKTTDHFFYQNIKEGGKFELDDKGQIAKADITASDDTSFRFGSQSVSVPKDARVIYDDGKISVSGKEGTAFDLKEYSKDANGNFLENYNQRIRILDENGVLINGQTIQGKNFQVGDINVRGMNNGLGTLTIQENGNILGKNSIADWKNLEIDATQKDVLLVKPGADISKITGNYIAPNSKLEANGDGFSLEFKPNNQWTNVKAEENDKLKLTFDRDIKVNFENRNEIDKAPLMSLTRNKDSSLIIENGGQEYVYSNEIKKVNYAHQDYTYANPRIDVSLGPTSPDNKGSVPMELEDVTEAIYDHEIRIPSAKNLILAGAGIPTKILEEDNWLFSNNGKVVPGKYYPEAIRSKGNVFVYGESFDIKLDSEGNIKYPIIAASRQFNFGGIDTSIGEIVGFDSKNHYLDKKQIDYIFGEDREKPLANILGERFRELKVTYDNYKDDPELLQPIHNAIDNTGRIEFFTSDRKGYIVGSETRGVGTILSAIELFKDDPELQSSILDKTDFKIGNYLSSDIEDQFIRYSASRDVLEKFLDKYGLDESNFNQRIRILNARNQYQVLHNFNEYFPEAKDLDFSDYEKFVLTKVNDGRGAFFDVKDHAEVVRGRIYDYYDARDKPIFTTDSSIRVYVAGKDKQGLEFEQQAALYGSLSERVKLLDISETKQSQKGFILGDLSNEKMTNSVFVFKNHGNPDGQYIGSFYDSNGKEYAPVISPEEMANALYHRYLKSGKNSNDRSFGDITVILESCYSTDYAYNTLRELNGKLYGLYGNPIPPIKTPNFIAIAGMDQVGPGTGMSGEIVDLTKNDGKFTLQDGIKLKNYISNSRSVPTVHYGGKVF